MDLNEKLKYYQDSTKQKKTAADGKNPKIPASLHALQQHFQAELCDPEAPYLRIIRPYNLSERVQYATEIKFRFLDRQTFSGSIPLSKCLFFDLETTGLAGGAGTFPFLQGFGYFTQDAFQVRQYLLPDFGREYFVFKELIPFFEQFDYFISYNGKSYDLPLLKSRFVLNRLDMEWNRFNHLDLLHLARRLWKNSYASCDLNTIESQVLQRTRQSDIPGSLIPQAYFNFIRLGVVHDMQRIIEHNYLDIVSLAELLLRLERVEQEPEILDDQALLRLAGLAYNHGSLAYLDHIAKIFQDRYKKTPYKILLWKSFLLKKSSRWSEAVVLWEELRNSKEYLFVALEELAKFYEHVAKDYAKALENTYQAIENLSVLSKLDPYRVRSEVMLAFLHRKQRLEAKKS